MPMHSESACFLGGSDMKVESNYEAEALTCRDYLERATKYAEMGVYIQKSWREYLQRATRYVEKRVYTV